MSGLEGIVLRLVGKQRVHARDLKLHLDIGGELIHHLRHRELDIALGIER